MKSIVTVLAGLITAAIPLHVAFALDQAEATAVQAGDTAEGALAEPVRGDFEVPVDSLVELLAVKRAVLALDDQWRVARLRNDAVLLDSVLADEWTTTVADPGGLPRLGLVQTKAHYLADVKSGERSYESITDGETVVRAYREAWVVTGRTTSTGYLKDLRTSETSVVTRMYAQRKGRWQMIASRSTMQAS